MTSTTSKRTLLTGASRGIGAAIARRLAAEGHELALSARSSEALDPLRNELGEFLSLPMDLGRRQQVDQALDHLLERWDHLDVLVLNAGTNGPTPLDDPDTQAFDRILEVNLSAQLRILRRLVPAMEKGGRILLVSSILGRIGIPVYHAYCASKAGLIGLARALALELAPKGIAVNALLPGWVETDMAEASMKAQAPAMGLDYEGARKEFMGAVPMGRMARPDEVADLAASLLSASTMVSGQCFAIDGGVLA